MNKKIIGVIISFILISAIFIPSTLGNNPTFVNTLYVGGTGPGNYTSIQSAIDDAINGDTVFVYDDSSPYNEQIINERGI